MNRPPYANNASIEVHRLTAPNEIPDPYFIMVIKAQVPFS